MAIKLKEADHRSAVADSGPFLQIIPVADDRRRAIRRPEDDQVAASAIQKLEAKELPVRYRMTKRVLDIVFALSGLLFLSPLLMLTALLVRLSGPGPILFRQERVGRGGKRFIMLKFRTMVVDAEARRAALAASNEQSGPVFKIRRDPRVTPVGRFLRKYSIDELPQLWNILRGEMTVVGPRPAIPSEVAAYRRWQTARLGVKPGLTCIWQVSGRNEIAFEDWMRMDLRYIDRPSVRSDIKLIARTVGVVVRGKGAY